MLKFDWYSLLNNNYYDTEVLETFEDVLYFRNDTAQFADYIHQFWGFTILGYHNYSTRYIEQFEKRLSNTINGNIDCFSHWAKILLCYSLINKELDKTIMVMLLKSILSNPWLEEKAKFNSDNELLEYKETLFHSITVTLQSLARLNIRNEAIAMKFANKIVEESVEPVADYTPKEISQIFSSYCKMDFYNAKLMRSLEDLFILKLSAALPEWVANMLLSHVNWAKFIVKQTFEEMGSKELFRKFKKYHIKFINLLLTDLLEKGVENINYKAWFFIGKFLSVLLFS